MTGFYHLCDFISPIVAFLFVCNNVAVSSDKITFLTQFLVFRCDDNFPMKKNGLFCSTFFVIETVIATPGSRAHALKQSHTKWYPVSLTTTVTMVSYIGNNLQFSSSY